MGSADIVPPVPDELELELENPPVPELDELEPLELVLELDDVLCPAPAPADID